MLPYVAESSDAALAVPSSVRRHRWRDVRVAILTGIRVPNQSAMRWFTRFAGLVWEPGLFRDLAEMHGPQPCAGGFGQENLGSVFEIMLF